MISAFHRQSSGAAASGDSSRQPEIVYFDATNRRKNKMRHLAGQGPHDGIAVAGNDGKKSLPASTRTAVHIAGGNGTSPAVNAKPPETTMAAAEKPDTKTISAQVSASPAQLNITISELETVLVNFVVEQTGYPAEMVELDADLEADLGIDSIKKAQMLGELAEQLDLKINISEDMSLDDFPTLRHITEFLRKAANEAESSVGASETTTVQEKPAAKQPSARPADVSSSNGSYRNGLDNSHTTSEKRSSVASAASTIAPEAPVRAASNAASKLNSADLQLLLVDFVVEQTGYPPEMVELDADLEADLGIDSIKKAQLFGELAEQLNIQIEITEEMSLDDFPTLRHVLHALESASAESTAVERVPAPRIPAFAKPISADIMCEEPRRQVPSGATHAGAATAMADPRKKSASASAVASTAAVVKVQDVRDSAKLAVASLKPEELEAFLVNFVVEQTGYPPEMVELDADLEADLGIDSIKKAQLFGELAENLDVRIQITEDMSLDDYRTLRDVLNLLAQEMK